MALSGEYAHGWLGPEVDEFAPEVTLVLRYILIQRRRQSWVVPSRRFCVVVDEINPSSVCKPHFPSAREGPQLGHGLLLDGPTGVVLAAVHPNVLLPPRVNPCRGPGIVVNKVGPSLGRKPLLPPRGEFACAGARGPGVHHRLRIRTLRRLLGLDCRGTRTCSILGQRTVLMPLSLNLCRLLLSRRVDSPAGAGSVPTRCSRVMVNVVSTSEVIFSALPAGRQTTLCILERAQSAVSTLLAGAIRGWLRRRRCGHAGRSVWKIRRVTVCAATGGSHGRGWSFGRAIGVE